jgi:transcriptional regulator
MDPATVLPGTLDLLILKALSLGPLYGYGILLRIEEISGKALEIEQGALYPALYRLERRGWIETEWGQSENNRRTKYYKLTPAGRKQFRDETDNWHRIVSAMAAALGARTSEV